MPQKTNPIGSEAIIGMASTAGALTSALYRAMEPEHERAAGEWQVEWQVLPQLACLAAGCLLTAAEVVGGLQVFPESMYRNLQADSGLVMAEAYMITLAPFLGREKAHDLVYEAALRVRREGGQLETVLGTFLDPEVYRQLQDKWPVRPEDYIGDPDLVCNAALDLWEAGLKKKEQQV
jgi:3-carboxy-cis,cis-muconate cycloisomerase